MINLFKKDHKSGKSIAKIWEQIISQMSKSETPIESVKSDGNNVILKFFKKSSDDKLLNKRTVLILLAYITIIISVSLVTIQMNTEASRIDKFHRDIIGRCIDKNWEVSLYKDGQLESCHNPKNID